MPIYTVRVSSLSGYVRPKGHKVLAIFKLEDGTYEIVLDPS